MRRTVLILAAFFAVFASAVLFVTRQPAPAAAAAQATGHATGAAPVPRSSQLDLAHASVPEVMAKIVDPAADALWESVGTTATVAGVVERSPTTDVEWEALVQDALDLGEGARALQVPERIRDDGPWRDYAKALEAASLISLQAARDRNRSAIFDSGEGLLKACDSCHNRYWSVEAQEAALKRKPEEAP